MTQAERINAIIAKMEELYPQSECSLDYTDPWQLLVSGVLATQCTDKRVNAVTPALFAKYPNVEAFAGADPGELQEYIRSTGFFNNKTKNLILAAGRISEVYGGQVPDTIEELVTLAGVGRKIANLIIGDVFGKPSVVIDTHAMRIFRRMGFTESKEPAKIEADMRRIIPPECSTRLCHQIVDHGRAVCTARAPKCGNCGVSRWCMKADLPKR